MQFQEYVLEILWKTMLEPGNNDHQLEQSASNHAWRNPEDGEPIGAILPPINHNGAQNAFNA